MSPALVLTFLLAVPPPADALAPAHGRVVDPDGRVVPHATVLVDGPLGVRTLHTGEDGTFAVPARPAAAYRILVTAPGLTADPTRLEMPADAGRGFEIVLRVAPVSEAVVVSAAQVPRPLSEAPATSTVITAADVEARQLESVADALRTVPGFTVARSGGRGAITSVFPRGGDSDYTLVLVDGMRVNAFGGGFDFSLLPFGDVDQVEVVRGPQSAVFGSDAIGGIVQVTTKHGGPAGGSASIEGGGEQTWHGAAGGHASRGAWTFGGGAERTTSDGYTGIARGTGEQVTNDNWHSATASGRLSWSPSASAALGGTYRWLDADRGNPGPYGSDPIGAFPGVNRVARGADTDHTGALSARFPWSRALAGRVEQRLQLTVGDLDNRYHDSFGDSAFRTRRTTARAQTDVAVTASTGISVGIEALAERARSTYILGESGGEVPISRSVTGLFGEVRQALGPRGAITAGVRVESIRRDALEADPNPFGPRPAFPSDSVTSVNPRIAATVAVWHDARGTARTTVHGSAGTGIRPPDAFEIAFTDNPSLAPERSRSADLGITHRLGGGLETDLTFFDNRYDDLIVAVGSLSAVSRYRTDNIANARARGIELAATWRTPVGITAHGGYTWLDTAVRAIDGTTSAPSPFSVGDPLLRRPRHQGSLGLTWASDRVSAFADARVRGPALDTEPNYGTFGGLFQAPGYLVVNAGGSWRLRGHADVFARVMNLLDRPYEEVYGYPAIGRTGMVGVRVAVGP